MQQRIRTLPWLAAIAALLAAFAASAALTATKAHALDPVTGRHRALVVVVQWDAIGELPPSRPKLTPGEVADVMDDIVNPWYASVSRGMFLGWDVDTAGTYTIDPRDSSFPNARCADLDPIYPIVDAADDAAENDGFDFDDYDQIVIYNEVPSGCPWASRGDIDRGKFVWLRSADFIDSHSIHELGHTLGLNHAGRIICRDGSGGQVTLSDNCETKFIPGDPFNVMSGDALNKFSFAASQQSALGWLGQRKLDLTIGTQPAHLYLQPLESTGLTIQAVRVQDADATYWVEYRASLGVDTTELGRPERTGVVIRRESPNDPTKPILLDTVIGTNANDFGDADLPAGRSWTNPLGNLRFTVNSIGPLGAEITIADYTNEFPYTPNVLGLDRTAATRAITAAGFTLGTVNFRVDQTCEYDGTVMDQTPGGGTQHRPGTTISITIGTRPTRGCS